MEILELYISHAGQCKMYMRKHVNSVKTLIMTRVNAIGALVITC